MYKRLINISFFSLLLVNSHNIVGMEQERNNGTKNPYYIKHTHDNMFMKLLPRGNLKRQPKLLSDTIEKDTHKNAPITLHCKNRQYQFFQSTPNTGIYMPVPLNNYQIEKLRPYIKNSAFAKNFELYYFFKEHKKLVLINTTNLPKQITIPQRSRSQDSYISSHYTYEYMDSNSEEVSDSNSDSCSRGRSTTSRSHSNSKDYTHNHTSNSDSIDILLQESEQQIKQLDESSKHHREQINNLKKRLETLENKNFIDKKSIFIINGISILGVLAAYLLCHHKIAQLLLFACNYSA